MADTVVGLVGLARAGKDTFAASLVERHGFRRLAFADALKDVAYDVNPWVVDGTKHHRLATMVDRMGWDRAKADKEVRRVLQTLGVAVRRHIGEETWVDLVLRKARDSEEPVVITDVRFPNEVEAVRSIGGTCYLIYRPGLGVVNLHESERLALAATKEGPEAVGITGGVVINGGSLTDLAQQADELAAYLLEGVPA